MIFYFVFSKQELPLHRKQNNSMMIIELLNSLIIDLLSNVTE